MDSNIYNKPEYLKAKAETLQYALNNVELFEQLMAETDPATTMYKSYERSAFAWRRVASDLSDLF